MKGMLGDLFSPSARTVRDEEIDKERVHQWQAQDPFKAMAHASYSGATLAGEGLGRVATAAAGGDPRTSLERNVEAVEQAKQQVTALGFDPQDPKSVDEFYKRVIQILQKQGLAAEALAVSKEWNAEKTKRSELDLKDRDLRRREALDASRNTQAIERNRILGARGLNTPETVQLLAALDATPADQPDKRKAITARLNFLATRAGKGVKFNDLGDVVQVVDAETGEVIREEIKGEDPLKPKDAQKIAEAKKDAEQAYAEYLAGLQRQYDAAVQLHNHPGLDGITGRFARHVGTDGVAGQIATTIVGDAARAALALHEQVTGGTFLAGLAKLKQASKTGATGLGAVSEREGDKVQSDAAALNRAQAAADYRAQLAIYIREMEGFAGRMASAAQQDKIAPKALAIKPLAAPGKGRSSAAPVPAPAPAPAPSGAPKVERWERDAQGKLRPVAR